MLLFKGCAPIVISHHESNTGSYPVTESTQSHPKINVLVSFLENGHYYSGPEDCKKITGRMQKIIVDEVKKQNIFDVVPSSKTAEITLNVCLHSEHYHNETASVISQNTLWVLPTWFSGYLLMEVWVSFPDGRSIKYHESDSFTAIRWLPLILFAYFWTPSELKGTAQSQFRRILIDLSAHHFFTSK